MHKPPTVEYPVGRSQFHAIVLLGIGAALACAQVWWFWHAEVVDWRQWLGSSVSVFVAVAALHAWLGSPVGSLRWDGQYWSWKMREIGVKGAVVIHLDLQTTMLVRFSGPGRNRQWFWLDRRADPANWRAFRRAAHVRAPTIGMATGSAPSLAPPNRGPVRGS